MENKVKVALTTLGCKLNFSETSTISRIFVENGYEIVRFESFADVYVINTCSVTQNADKQFKSLVSKAHNINHHAYIVAIGCYAQLNPDELSSVFGVDLVLGSKEKFKILDYLGDITKNKFPQIHSCEINESDFYVPSYSIGDRTRSFLKVQDGCDYKCSYCTIPLARGMSRSGNLDKILESAKEIAKTDVKEIVLTGVNIGDYGKGEFGDKKHDSTFLDLIKKLDEIDGIDRFRISSIEPNLLSDEIINFVANSNKFVPHFHIPLQSGSNSILRYMRRRYNTELYSKRIKYIKSLMPDVCIGADVIVGFPGEDEKKFMETYKFIQSLGISYLHVFSYSERRNTQAAEMSNSIDKSIRAKRSKILRTLSVKMRRAFYNKQIGNKHNILFESENKNGYVFGFTENYVRVKTNWNYKLVNTISNHKLIHLGGDGFVNIEKVKKLAIV